MSSLGWSVNDILITNVDSKDITSVEAINQGASFNLRFFFVFFSISKVGFTFLFKIDLILLTGGMV